jgi:methylmalonyl-CoA/ethylmalonyl-CoA epimerase
MITKIHHVGAVVRSADEALRFWRDTLGLEVTADRVIEDQGVRGVLLKVGNSEIELLEPTRADTGVARFLETRGEGMHHICFESDDVAAELTAAAARGLDLIDAEPRPGLAGMIGFVHPKANHGVLVEFATPPGGQAHGGRRPDGGVGATHIDHVVIGSNRSADTARHFATSYDIEIKRTMSRPGTGAHMEFAKLDEVVLEFAGPGTPPEDEAPKAQLRGVVLAVTDAKAAVQRVRAAGYDVTDPNPAVQPTAVITAVKSGTNGVPFAMIQYGARPAAAPTQ